MSLQLLILASVSFKVNLFSEIFMPLTNPMPIPSLLPFIQKITPNQMGLDLINTINNERELTKKIAHSYNVNLCCACGVNFQ
jgi:hypothetical protein